MSTVSRTWKDPVTNLDLAAAQKVSEQNWDDAMSDIAYVGNALEPVTLLNKSGGALSLGAVVIIDPGNAGSFTTSTRQGDPRVFGVVMDASIASNGAGRVAALGPVATVNVQGNVAVGDFLECSTTVGRARSNGAAKSPGTFAIATSAYGGGSAGTVSALLLPGCGAGAILSGSSIMLLLPHSFSADANSAPVGSTNQVRVVRVTLAVGFWVNSIAFDVRTAEAGKFMGVGLYSLDGSTKLIDSGALSVASTGVKSTTLASTFYLPPGQYWLAVTSDTAGPLNVSTCANPSGSALDNTGTLPYYATAANGGSAGVLPATLGALTGINQGQQPLVRLAG